MSLTVRGFDLEEEIRQHKFDHVARIFREGKAGELTPKEQNLLADYFEGKLRRPKGRPRDNEQHLFAENLYSEYQLLRKYGRTSAECSEYISENFGALGKGGLNPLKGQGMSRQDAIQKLADIHIMGTKNVERLVDLGKKLEEYAPYKDVNLDT